MIQGKVHDPYRTQNTKNDTVKTDGGALKHPAYQFIIKWRRCQRPSQQSSSQSPTSSAVSLKHTEIETTKKNSIRETNSLTFIHCISNGCTTESLHSLLLRAQPQAHFNLPLQREAPRQLGPCDSHRAGSVNRQTAVLPERDRADSLQRECQSGVPIPHDES
jgi:hypothetical protein